ncbi:MAG: hypothetical protein ACP5NF_06125 [Thermoanaerobaculum sp.]
MGKGSAMVLGVVFSAAVFAQEKVDWRGGSRTLYPMAMHDEPLPRKPVLPSPR